MRRFLGGLAVGLACGAGVVLAQENWKTPDPFAGKWRINLDKTVQFTGSKPRVEDITIKVENGVQDYKNEYSTSQAAPHVQGYESKYNEPKWVPYMNYATGKPLMHVMTIKVDDRTHYRVIKRLDGTAGGVMMRRLSADGRSYSSIDLDINGKTNYIRVFDRQ